ncbi:DUF1707 SHOCT-like domain-containing protein [Streptomyces spiramenti]|uniref:DUF1707 domain-containing protein n=1 Tax=Streptomyces spiramenti TaxID=2720606 RepID=A0ABX1AVS3_9ACTN|nr:DUF1707 domain-containing protein [Streptomyces spiramenti]NJP68507.1 DUF1707 domain-containing protein [Streptomyces spiramenti]
MTNLPHSPDHDPRADLRASDSDREAVAEQLREAAGDGRLDLEELQERLDRTFAAKTYGELAPITADLPSGRAHAVQRREAEPAPPLVLKGGAAGDSRKGHWVVPQRLYVHGGMGGVKVDFTQAELTQPLVVVDVHGDIGGVTIVVPTTWRVELVHTESGLGGVTNKTAKVPPPEGPAPVLRATCSGGIGGVTIRHPNRWELRKLRK